MSRINGNMYVDGALGAKSLSVPAGSIVDASVNAAAAIAATKCKQRRHKNYAQPNTTATAETRVIHTVYGATGTVQSFKAGSIGANVGAATITVDLKKNGTTILSAAISLTSSTSALAEVAGTISSAGLVEGDVLTVVTTATAGGGTLGTGLFAEIVVDEDPQ